MYCSLFSSVSDVAAVVDEIQSLCHAEFTNRKGEAGGARKLRTSNKMLNFRESKVFVGEVQVLVLVSTSHS